MIAAGRSALSWCCGGRYDRIGLRRIPAQARKQVGVSSDLSDPFEGVEIPPALEASFQRHRQHLADLVVSLRQAGVSEEQIEASVSGIVESYKVELIHAIKAMRVG